MLDTCELKKLIIQGIDEFSPLIGLHSVRHPMTAKQRIKEVCNSRSLLCWQCSSFWPLCKVVSTRDDITADVIII